MNISLLKDKKNLFLIIFLVCLLCSAVAAFLTQGRAFANYFCNDLYESFMDFFHSVNSNNETLGIYPPLAAIPYRILRLLVPSDFWPANLLSLEEDNAFLLRSSLYGAMMLLGHILIFIEILMLILVKKIGTKTFRDNLLIFCMVFSGPVLYSLQRGNNIVYVMLFSLLFFVLKDSKSPLYREIALICLAIAACTKIYPAIFGLCLLKDRQWQVAFRCILYGLILFFVPLIFFNGGLNNVIALNNNIQSFANSNHGNVIGVFYNFSVNNFLIRVQYFINQYIGEFQFAVLTRLVISLFTLLFGVAIFFFLDKKWQQQLVLAILCIIIPGVSYPYTTIFLMIPLLEYFSSEDSNLFATVFFALSFSILAIVYRLHYIVVMSGMALFLIYFFIEAIKHPTTKKLLKTN